MGKGKAKVVPQERKDFRSDRFSDNNRSRRDYIEQPGSASAQAVHAVFRDPLHQVLEKIRNEPFFKWPNGMAGDPTKCNRNLYCQYHQEPGHTTEDCRNLKNHLDQLVRGGKLSHLLHHSSSRQEQTNVETRRDNKRHLSRLMLVARLPAESDDRESKKAKRMASPMLGFSDEDKVGTIQPHDDVLVIMLRIEGYDVKRVLVD